MNVQENVKQYYGDVLKSSGDLRTDACSTLEATPPHLQNAFANIHPEVAARYYGCGLVAPPLLANANVLDLGSGSGRDAYALAQLVGPGGRVVGVDMTPEQLSVARDHLDWHQDRFGYSHSNVRFLEGDIEKLNALDLAPESFDVVISNCVINLCTNKKDVFDGAWRLLKPGGEMYFADVYADQPLPDAVKSDPRAHGECLAGALFWRDFISLANAAGFSEPRLVAHRPLLINDEGLQDLLTPAQFQSATYRLIKADTRATEHDGHISATYVGDPDTEERVFNLDKFWAFERDTPKLVDAATLRLLQSSRYSRHFRFEESVDRAPQSTVKPDPFKSAPTAAATSANCCS